jgi:hypothetical protein
MSAYQKQDPHVAAQASAAKGEDESAKAARLFLERVGFLPDVLRVEGGHDRGLNQPSFRIYLRNDDQETEYAIYRLEAEIYQLCPRAYLDVLVLVEAEGAEPNPDVRAAAR